MFSNIFIEKIRQAKKVTVLTGAGISAESGVPTFRGEEGLWKKYKPEELANFDAFMQNPELVWEWYDFRRKLISDVKINPAHISIARMESLIPEYTLITQNVDGLHRKAGSIRILELHGNIMHSKCVQCGKKSEKAEMKTKGVLPKCDCGGLMRPDVVWFGEMLPQDTLQRAFRAAEACDLFLSIGTSALVQPAASLPVFSKNAGAYVVEINKNSTVISDCLHESILGLAGEILPKLLKETWNIDI